MEDNPVVQRTLAILTRNEIEGLRVIFNKIPLGVVDEVIAVDYKSSDGTAEFLQNKGIKVVHQEKPGRGEAFRLAFKKSKGDFLVFFSPDGNEDPKDIPRLIKKLKEGYDMVIASRFLPGGRNEESGRFLPLRMWANKAFSLIANLLWNRGRFITDTLNGYRAIKREAFEKIDPDAPGYAIEYQLSIRAMKLGLKVGETPTIEEPKIGSGRQSPSLATGLLLLKYLLQEILIGNRF